MCNAYMQEHQQSWASSTTTARKKPSESSRRFGSTSPPCAQTYRWRFLTFRHSRTLFRKFLSRSLSLPLLVSLSQVHKTALERVEQQGNLAKQKAEDATNQAQEGLREAKATQLLAQVPLKLLHSKRMCGRYRFKFSLALPLCFALSLLLARVCARSFRRTQLRWKGLNSNAISLSKRQRTPLPRHRRVCVKQKLANCLLRSPPPFLSQSVHA